VSPRRSVSSGVHEAASALTNAALHVLDGAVHPWKVARVMGRLVMRPVAPTRGPPGSPDPYRGQEGGRCPHPDHRV
jgi:hypothetical protein